jgi:integrase/recombinase XerD
MVMTNWYESSIKALQLNGKGERTQQAYTRAVRMLSEFYAKTADQINEEELQEYFLHRKNVNKCSPNTMRICYCGIRFFFENVLKRDWHIPGILRAQNERRLPAVLSLEKVRRVLACVKTAHNHAFLTTFYSCGLRLQEAMYLEVSDIDNAPERMMIHVHRGKALRTAMCRCRMRPLAFSAATGPLIATRDSFSRHWGETAKEPKPVLSLSKGCPNPHGQKQCPGSLPSRQI